MIAARPNYATQASQITTRMQMLRRDASPGASTSIPPLGSISTGYRTWRCRRASSCGTFQILHSNDLIRSGMAHDYLLGGRQLLSSHNTPGSNWNPMWHACHEWDQTLCSRGQPEGGREIINTVASKASYTGIEAGGCSEESCDYRRCLEQASHGANHCTLHFVFGRDGCLCHFLLHMRPN